MIETIKKLVESPVYEDNRLALIFITQHYTIRNIKEIMKLSEIGGRSRMFGKCPDNKRANGVFIKNYCLFYCAEGYVNIYKDNYYLDAKENENFIRWNLKEEEDK